MPYTRVVGVCVCVCARELSVFGADALGLLSFDVIKWKIKLFSARSLKESGQIGNLPVLPPWAIFDLTFIYIYTKASENGKQNVKCEPTHANFWRCSSVVCFFECR
jgi:hypothetical protein